MNIRKMKISDVPFFNIVRNECSIYLHDKSTHTLKEAYHWFKNIKDDSPYFICEIECQPIGYFRTSKWHNKSCYIGMDIHKEYRGQGFAVDAYKKMFEILNKEYDIMTVELEVLKSNKRAHNLYNKLGFVETKREPFLNDDNIYMKLKISQGF